MGSQESPRIVTLLTDFGLYDTFVGQMKGVILSIDPSIRIVDLSHQVMPFDIGEAAHQLATAVDAFPHGTVHVAVVDPGVGTSRRAVVIDNGRHLFVGPDNGVFSYVVGGSDAVREIRNRSLTLDSVAATFHGRDIFAPTGAHLASGQVDLDAVGPPVEPADLVLVQVPVKSCADALVGSVVSIDRFGNCVTRIDAAHLDPEREIESIRCRAFSVLSLTRTFGDVAVGRPAALIGSAGTIELVVREGSAADEFRIIRGDRVTVRYRPR